MKHNHPSAIEEYSECPACVFAEYNRQTKVLSISARMREVPAYIKLLQLASESWLIPELLEELRGEEWGISTQILLHDLTGQDPAADARHTVDDTGFVGINVRQSADLWIEWGITNGVIPRGRH